MPKPSNKEITVPDIRIPSGLNIEGLADLLEAVKELTAVIKEAKLDELRETIHDAAQIQKGLLEEIGELSDTIQNAGVNDLPSLVDGLQRELNYMAYKLPTYYDPRTNSQQPIVP